MGLRVDDYICNRDEYSGGRRECWWTRRALVGAIRLRTPGVVLHRLVGLLVHDYDLVDAEGQARLEAQCK